MFKIFGKHYGAERFFILLFVLFGLIVGLFSYSAWIRHERNQFSLGSTPLYTWNYAWSRTSAKGNVVRMMSNSSNTAVFLLIKNEDVALTSTNADDYQVFLTGTNEPLQNNPSMTIYTFGLTGYVGFYFTDAKGFANQLYTLTVRADSAGSEAADESMFNLSVQDASFRDHNQIRLWLNFGASGIEKLPVMDDPGLTPMKIMCDANLDLYSFGITDGVSGFEGLKSSGQGTLEAMSKSLVAIKQYQATLTDQGIEIPDLPYYIADDYVDTTPFNPLTEPTTFDPSMLPAGTSGSSGTRFTGQFGIEDNSQTSSAAQAPKGDGERVWTDLDGTTYEYKYLHTKYLYPGTASLRWQGVKLSEGLITQTRFYTDEDMTLDEAYKSFATWAEDCKTAYEGEMKPSVKYDSWRRTDGSYINMSSSDPLEQQVVALINKYVSEVNRYMQLKNTYLTNQVSMLQSEAAVQGLRTMIYSNNGSKVQNLWLY